MYVYVVKAESCAHNWISGSDYSVPALYNQHYVHCNVVVNAYVYLFLNNVYEDDTSTFYSLLETYS